MTTEYETMTWPTHSKISTLVIAHLLVFLMQGTPAPCGVVASGSTPPFDVAPFTLPNCSPGEIRFEETRDVVAVELRLDGPAPDALGLSYLQENWPGTRLENARDMTQPCQFGWTRVDDWFNGRWKRAKTRVTRGQDGHARIEFEPLTSEFPDERGYDVRFRRTLGLRIEGLKADAIKQVRIFTRSAPARTGLRVELNAGATNARRRDQVRRLQLPDRQGPSPQRLPQRGPGDLVGTRQAGGLRARGRSHDAGLPL